MKTQPASGRVLGPTQKAALRLVVESGWRAVARRQYPGPWRWLVENADGIGCRDLTENTVAAWVECGAGRVVTVPGTAKRAEYRAFESNPAGAALALAAFKRRGPDEAQLNWIPEDHPSRGGKKTA